MTDMGSVIWNVISNRDIIYHTVTFGKPVVFSEVASRPEWGTVYYATKTVSDNTPLHIVTHSRLFRIAILHIQLMWVTFPSSIFTPMGTWTTKQVKPIG
jgi:hypothetical protein